MNKYAEALYAIGRVREQTDTALLFYSAGGKDSIVLLDMLATRFPKVVCYFMYQVPDLDHEKQYLLWAKRKYPNVRVEQIPHYQITTYLKYGVFCDPQPDIKELNERDVADYIMEREGVPFIFNGMKGADGYMKLMRLKRHLKREGWYYFRGMVYPLATWVNADAMQYIKNRHLIMPFHYGYEPSRSQGFGLYKECFDFLMWEYPQDVAKTLEKFPYASTLLDPEEKRILEEKTGWRDFR